MTVIVLGTSGFAVELADVLADMGRRVEGFVGLEPDCVLPGPWLGGDEVLEGTPRDADYLIAVGKPTLRRRLAENLRRLGLRYGRCVHPAAWVAAGAEVGEGVIVYPNATVHARVRLGTGVMVNSNVSIGHETSIGAFSTISPGVSLAGRMTIGEETWWGIGASGIELLSVASGTLIGGGATVVRDIAAAGTWVGTPARRMGGGR
ncbi:MAG: acetyltransferase [Alphaproteobacteria bacterium]